MATSLRVKESILHGESEGKTFYEIITAGTALGMVTFDDYILKLYSQGLITEDIAMGYASRKSIVGRGLDTIKSERGEKTTTIDSLEIDHGYEGE